MPAKRSRNVAVASNRWPDCTTLESAVTDIFRMEGVAGKSDPGQSTGPLEMVPNLDERHGPGVMPARDRGAAEPSAAIRTRS